MIERSPQAPDRQTSFGLPPTYQGIRLRKPAKVLLASNDMSQGSRRTRLESRGVAPSELTHFVFLLELELPESMVRCFKLAMRFNLTHLKVDPSEPVSIAHLRILQCMVSGTLPPSAQLRLAHGHRTHGPVKRTRVSSGRNHVPG